MATIKEGHLRWNLYSGSIFGQAPKYVSRANVIEWLRNFHNDNNLEWYFWENFKDVWWLYSLDHRYPSVRDELRGIELTGSLQSRIMEYIRARSGNRNLITPDEYTELEELVVDNCYTIHLDSFVVQTDRIYGARVDKVPDHLELYKIDTVLGAGGEVVEFPNFEHPVIYDKNMDELVVLRASATQQHWLIYCNAMQIFTNPRYQLNRHSNLWEAETVYDVDVDLDIFPDNTYSGISTLYSDHGRLTINLLGETVMSVGGQPIREGEMCYHLEGDIYHGKDKVVCESCDIELPAVRYEAGFCPLCYATLPIEYRALVLEESD